MGHLLDIFENPSQKTAKKLHEETSITKSDLKKFREKNNYFSKIISDMDGEFAEQYNCVEWNSTIIAKACGNREIATK